MCVSFNSNASITLLEQELLTSKKHPSSLTAFNGVRVAQSLVFCVVFARSLLSFLFLLTRVLSIIVIFPVSFDTCFVYHCYLSCFFWHVFCLSFCDLRHLIIALVFSHMIFVWLKIHHSWLVNIAFWLAEVSKTAICDGIVTWYFLWSFQKDFFGNRKSKMTNECV